MKRSVIIAMLGLIAGAIGSNALEFLGGYNAFPAVIGLLPAALVALAWMVIATCWAVVVMLIALFRRRIGNAAILAFTIAVCWIIGPMFQGRSTFLLGLATRLHVSSSPAEIQSVAQTCLSLMPNGGAVYGPRKVMGPPAQEAEQSQRVWNAISSHSFVHIDGDTCVIFVRPPEVMFTWGGALPGHCGIHVGPRIDQSSTFFYDKLRFADGITLFRGQ